MLHVNYSFLNLYLQMESGQVLESFSIQLVCLAIWKEALIVCKSWAETVGSCEHSSSNEGRGIKMEEGEGLSVVNTCSLMEREFAFAVQRAETLSSHITVVHRKCTSLISELE